VSDFPIQWAKGGAARVVSLAADAVVLMSTVPSPPGSRIDGVIAATEAAPEIALKVKVHVSRREEAGTFRLEGRPLDMTRAVRERLLALAEA
jgi:succinyl-CoA synthetase beta subunit